LRAEIRDKEKESCTDQEEIVAMGAMGGRAAMGVIPAATPEVIPAHIPPTATATTAVPINQAAGGGSPGS